MSITPGDVTNLLPLILPNTANVYDVGDNYVAVVKTGLACRLGHLDPGGAATGNERAELAELRRLLWDPAYVMPIDAQVLIDGRRWNTMRGTYMALDAAGPAVVRACDVRPA